MVFNLFSCGPSKWGMVFGALFLLGCASNGMNVEAIDSITLERSGTGTAASTRLTLQRDGTAHWQVVGNARLGAGSQAFRGTLQRPEFEAMARLIEQQRFFALQEQYADPQLADGPWLQLGVRRGNQLKQVFSRDGAGPPSLHSIVQAIERQRERLTLMPAAPSGPP